MALQGYPGAVPTPIGYAHPITGEQLTSRRPTTAQLAGDVIVSYYKPNSKNASFIDPQGSTEFLVQSFVQRNKVVLAVQTLDVVRNVDWTFGDSTSASAAGREVTHVYPNRAISVTYSASAVVHYATSSTSSSLPLSVVVPATIPAYITNSVLPSITGTAQDTHTLTAVPGTWSSDPTSPTYTYVWYADNVVIAGQTASTYVVVTGDVGKKISVRVTATNSGGASASATSAQTATVIA
jgi:hypothetical protein